MRHNLVTIKYFCLLLLLFILPVSCRFNSTQYQDVGAPLSSRPQVPIMGWASWNNFRTNVSGDIIKAQADALITSGMSEAGYLYVNIDDGFFGGRDENGNLLVHPERFPDGMKSLAGYIHSKGLKAGIYSDAGINTCASYWDKDTIGVGMGLYGHEHQDLELMLSDWGYDFIKIDWCGGEWLGLDEEVRYTELGQIIRSIRPDVVYNVCRWQFPGKWVVPVADSWRISGDIANNFESVMNIVDLNAELWRYAGPGHVNDMDMLQVGRGMNYEEDKTHFTMWCMMNSPLLAGNDLTNIDDQTLDILTNREMIAINQDPLVYQARRLTDRSRLEVWARPLVSTISGRVAVVLLNRSEKEDSIGFHLADVSIDASQSYTMRDIWNRKDYDVSRNDSVGFVVPSHGVVALRLEGKSLPYNVFQYE